MGVYVYCICKITKFWKDINHDLSNRGYKGIKAYIPYVNVLKSTRAGKNVYTEVPLLFNYGFIRMNTEKAVVKALEDYAVSLSTKIYDIKIRNTNTVQKAQLSRQGLFAYDPTCTAAIDYKAFINEVIRHG